MEPSDPEIAERLRAILQSDEFQSRPSQRISLGLAEAVRRLMHWLGDVSPAMRAVVIAACVLTLVAIAIRMWRLYRAVAQPLRTRIHLDATRKETIPSPETLIRRARSLAEAGAIRDAARALQQALLLQTCLERRVPWRSSLSDWEWVRILRPPERVANVTRTTERLAFGPEPTRAAFDACVREVHAWVAEGAPSATESS